MGDPFDRYTIDRKVPDLGRTRVGRNARRPGISPDLKMRRIDLRTPSVGR